LPAIAPGAASRLFAEPHKKKPVSQSAGLTATLASSYRHLQPAITGLPQKKAQLQKRPF
jgi:hypothetical protein